MPRHRAIVLCVLMTACTERCIEPDGDAKSSTTAESPAPSSPAATSAPPKTPVAQIAAHGDITCALTRGGEVYCWGDDAYSSSTMSEASLPAPTRTRPTRVANVTDATAIAVGASVGCAIVKSGALMCWTDRTADQSGPAPSLVAVDMHVADVASVSINCASLGSVCALKKDATVSCLHASYRGLLPRDERRVEGLANVKSFAEGDAVHCAARDDKLTCWGWPSSGFKDLKEALGSPPMIDGVQQVSAGSAFACVVASGGAVACFGDSAPKHADVDAKLVRAGVYHMCVIDSSSRVACWGDNRFGQLGSHVEVTDALDVAVGAFHTCALDASGRVWCWGRDTRGQLGDGTVKSQSSKATEVDFP